MQWTDRCAGEFQQAFRAFTCAKQGGEVETLLNDMLLNGPTNPTFAMLKRRAEAEVVEWMAEADLDMAQAYLDILKALKEYVQ